MSNSHPALILHSRLQKLHSLMMKKLHSQMGDKQNLAIFREINTFLENFRVWHRNCTI